MINVNSSSYVKSLEELFIIQDSVRAISLLTNEGYSIYVVSNQSAIGRGLTTLENIEEIHREIDKEVLRRNGRIAGYYFCPHTPTDSCECRKPKTAMLRKIEKDNDINLKGSFFVGDAITDVELANNYGLKSILVRTGHGRETEKHMKKNQLVFENLLDAVQKFILIR